MINELYDLGFSLLPCYLFFLRKGLVEQQIKLAAVNKGPLTSIQFISGHLYMAHET